VTAKELGNSRKSQPGEKWERSAKPRMARGGGPLLEEAILSHETVGLGFGFRGRSEKKTVINGGGVNG